MQLTLFNALRAIPLLYLATETFDLSCQYLCDIIVCITMQAQKQIVEIRGSHSLPAPQHPLDSNPAQRSPSAATQLQNLSNPNMNSNGASAAVFSSPQGDASAAQQSAAVTTGLTSSTTSAPEGAYVRGQSRHVFRSGSVATSANSNSVAAEASREPSGGISESESDTALDVAREGSFSANIPEDNGAILCCACMCIHTCTLFYNVRTVPVKIRPEHVTGVKLNLSLLFQQGLDMNMKSDRTR